MRRELDDGTLVAAAVVGLIVVTVVPFALPLLDGGSSATTPDTVGPTTGTSRATTSDQPATATEPHGDDSTGAGAAGESTPDLTPAPTDAVRCSVGEAGTDAAGLASIRQLDADDPTGEDVTVAIVDPTGFDVDDARIQEDVTATESFATRSDLSIGNDGRNQHGTATAVVVDDIAPDADLLLANFRTAHDFTEAVEWAVEQDADVVVAPAVFYAKPDDGSAPVAEAVADAADAGVPVVVPTGNAARQHWEGTYDGDGWVEFADGRDRLELQGAGDEVRLWLWWNESAGARHNLTIHLYEDTGDGLRQIGRSRSYPRGPVGTNQVLVEQIRTNDFLSQPVTNGSYYVRVSGPDDAAHHVELVSTSHRFDETVLRGSLAAPATARRAGVVAVGASELSEPRPLARSGRGPTNDGRPGIDLLAPGTAGEDARIAFTGTSVATAYAGGVATLLQAADPSLTAAETERVLEATAASNRETPTLAAGHGLLDADDALTCVTSATSAADE